MDLKKPASSNYNSSLPFKASSILDKLPGNCHNEGLGRDNENALVADIDIDLREVYFVIMHFLSTGPCRKTFAQLSNELMEHQLLPRRYHAWHSRTGMHSGGDNDDGVSFPLTYDKLLHR